MFSLATLRRALSCRTLIWLAVLSATLPVAAADVRFQRLLLTEEFQAEGAAVGDIDNDGQADVVAGPHWYRGPEFRQRHRYAEGGRHSIAGYSDHFFSWCDDLNGDGQQDILVVGMPGEPAYWYEHPGAAASSANAPWMRHLVVNDAGGESPAYIDLNGDGRRDLVCVHEGKFGFATIDPAAPAEPWSFQAVSDASRTLGRFTHGMGLGDVDRDGRLDLLESAGWWRQASEGSFALQPQRFAEAGGSQMFAYDFDGDGDQDVVSVQNAHGYGLTWFERRGAGADQLFVPHPIMPTAPSKDTLSISQMHSLALVDIDGDGVQDLVTGKRYWAHGGRDPGAFESPALYWLRTVRDQGSVRFEPHLIDARSGVGTQLTAQDINGDGRVDLLVANKLGVFVYLQTNQAPHAATSPAPSDVAVIGTDLFRTHIRETEPRTAEQERQSFVVPPGFDVELVASEPDIAKPLNMAFDNRGRLWVTSTVEYPVPAPNDRPARDSIKVLEDTTGDGAYDKVTTFAEGLNIPMGLYPVDNGVICFDIPNIVLLTDSDGDGVADQRELLYGPFDTTRDTHGMCSAFTRGYDGWLYACHGFNNRSDVAGKDGNRVQMRSGNTFRMALDGSRIEHFGFGQVNPFGLTIDRFGDVYTADCHTKPVNLVLHGGYHDSFGLPHDGLGFVPNVLEHLHNSTGIGGIGLGESLRYPAIYRESSFGGNVVTGRVNRDTLGREGAKVIAGEEPDFVVSADPWFRPVDIQVGPDGALYIADFYNRIIGHYEVKLDHPGRDRRRGRIWRVVYRGEDGRRDAAPMVKSAGASLAGASLAAASVAELFEMLPGSAPWQQRRVINRLADSRLAAASDEAARRLRADAADEVKIVCLWLLARAKKLTADALQIGWESASPEVRAHAYRAGAFAQLPMPLERLRAGLGHGDGIGECITETSPTVQRIVAIAASETPVEEQIQPLLDRLLQLPTEPTHLSHALRIALKAHLLNEAWFDALAGRLRSAEAPAVLGICLAIKTPASGNFVAARLSEFSGDPESTLELAAFAARYANDSATEQLVSTVRKRFAAQRETQVQLLMSLDDGIRQRGSQNAAVRQWALDLSRDVLAEASEGSEPIAWTFAPSALEPRAANCWSVSNRRSCSDGTQNATLFSSFPQGEQRTGLYRSGMFSLGEELTFYLAGHDGFPDKPLQGKNLVRLRSGRDHRILHSSPPPRNDTAQLIRWDTKSWQGQPAYLELIDDDNGNAYAWLAVGRFSEPRLNPSDRTSALAVAANLVGRFRLRELKQPLLTHLRQLPDSALAGAIAQLESDGRLKGAAELLGFGIEEKLRATMVSAVEQGDGEAAVKSIQAAVKSLSSPQQRSLALALTAETAGMLAFVDLIEAGHLNAALVQDPALRDRLAAADNRAVAARVQKLLQELPDEAPELVAELQRRQAAYLASGGDGARGAKVFETRCAVCHQVAGRGKKVGPNLDGIGNRGVARLLEDILAPNRNVDVAFRATVVVTADGEIVTGALQPGDDSGAMLLIDANGKEVRVAKADVARQKQTRSSPMPANFATAIPEEEFRALLAYLLSIR
ncbi:MAG: VCBS repeat-containing protein [Planctomycetales bacterium]|nr:VCBS repeat-containing protein [Planctomycetales bacterium]